MRLRGATLFEIALEFDVSKSAVWQRLRHVTSPIRNVGSRPLKADPSRAAILREQGLTYSQIATRLGVCQTTAFKYVRRAGQARPT
jgi:predicted DNA binding protein